MRAKAKKGTFLRINESKYQRLINRLDSLDSNVEYIYEHTRNKRSSTRNYKEIIVTGALVIIAISAFVASVSYLITNH